MRKNEQGLRVPLVNGIKKASHFRHWHPVLLWGGVAVCALIILYLVFLGQYIRPFQDDFYYYSPIKQKEMYDLLHERFTWTGRLSTTTAHLAIGWLGVHWIVPFISFSSMLAGLYAFLQVIAAKFFEITKRASKKLSLLLALGLTIAIFLVTPSPYSSIYWLSAAPIHFWSYGLILLYSAYILKRSFGVTSTLKPFDYVLMTLAPLVIGMLGEIAMFTLAGLVSLVAVFAVMNKSKKVALMIVPNTIGLSVAFYALFFSLGAVIRRGAEGSPPFSEVVSHAPYVIIKNLHALVFHLMNNKAVLIVIFLVAVMLGIYCMRTVASKRSTMAFIAALTLLCGGLMCLNFVGVYSSVKLNVAWSRTQTFSVIIVIGLLMLYGAILGSLLREYMIRKGNQRLMKRFAQSSSALVGLIIVLNLGFLPYIGQFGTMIRARAVVYDKRESSINRIKKDGNISCPIKLPVTYLIGTQENMDLFQDPAHAVNAGVVRYYRLPCQIIGT